MQILNAGPHTVTLARFRGGYSDSWLGVEITIMLESDATRLYSSGWVADTETCGGRSVDRIPTSILLNEDNYYSFSSDMLALSPTQQQAVAPVRSIQFTVRIAPCPLSWVVTQCAFACTVIPIVTFVALQVPEACIVYAEVEYDPSYGDVSVRLNASSRYFTIRFAQVSSGTAMLHTVVDKLVSGGVYKLEIYQPSPALGDPHCVPFTFRLVIRDAFDSDTSDLVCSELSRLPSDLNDVDGNSQVR